MDKYSQEIIDIEVLKEILRSFRITKKYVSDRNRTTEPALLEEMSIVSILAVYNKTG